ncbi:MAG TPA: bifunctional UDP-sugar hydrolase/5'-nucleotidase [Bryobacteraceae bacterium]|jgi:2',3'-cyclic-nucleotide 2'-phosphodiesterase (5'-nucleotidase family)
MVRRAFSGFLLTWVLFCAAAPLSQAEIRRITILHTNDLHARLEPLDGNRGGFAQLAATIQREAADGNCLYLNAGDLVQGTPVSTLFQGSPLYEIANLIPIDAATFGNHEFDYGWRKAIEYRRMAKYPLVIANVVDAQNQLIAPPYVMKTVNGVRIAIIGAIMSNLLDYTTAQELGPIRVLPVVESVARYAKDLRSKSDLIVVLGHIEIKEAEDILRLVPEVNLVIKGHNHGGTATPITVEDRIAVWCKAYGVELGRLDLEVNTAEKKVISSQWKRIRVDALGASDAAVKNAIDRWEGRVSKIVDVRIGEAQHSFDPPALQALVEQAILAETHADFTFVNPGGIRDHLAKGPILARAIWNILPFDDRIVVASVRGELLSEALRRGRDVEAEQLYTVALPDFVAENQRERMRLGLDGMEFRKTGEVLRDLVIEWVKTKKMLD